MQQVKTAPSRSARGGRRRGGLRNNNVSDDDNRKPTNGRRVQFESQPQVAPGESAAASARPGQHSANGASSGRARSAASSSRGDTAGAKRGKTISQINSHLGPRPAPPQAKTASTRGQGHGIEERLQSLKNYREQEISLAVANGTLSQPGKQMSLAEAITLVGTCQDMCPEIERVRRIREGGVFKEEKDDHNEPDETKMVKAFHRSSAGDEVQIPSDLRPPSILKRTLDYLVSGVIGNASNFASVHHFVWDRTRAIRNDFSIQQVTKAKDVEIAINTFERCARFHIVALHTLATAKQAHGTTTYSAQQDREQLDKTLLSLIQYYEDKKSRMQCRNEAEFRAYQILFAIQSPTPNLEDRIQSWGPDIVRNPRVQTAIRLYQAACTTDGPQGPLRPHTNHKIAQEHWRRFWHLIDSPQTSFLMACVAEIYFPLIRHRALTSICSAYKTKGSAKHVNFDWTLDDLRGVLGFQTEDEVQDYVEKAGFATSETESGAAVLDLHSVRGDIPDPGLARDPSAIVERKRHGRSLPAVIDGLSVREARNANMIEHSSDQDAEESLFIPDDRNPAQSARPAAFNPSASTFSPAGSIGKKDNTWTQSQGIEFAKPAFGTGFGAPAAGSGHPSSSATSSHQDQHPSFFSRTQSQLSSGSFSPNQGARPLSHKPSDHAATQGSAQPSQDAILEKEKQIAEETAKQRAKEAAARAADEQRRAAEENERKRVAEEAAHRRAAEEAEQRRLAEIRDAAERKRRAEELALQEAQARKAMRSGVLDQLAEQLVSQPNSGFMDQFILYITEPMIVAATQDMLHKKAEEEAALFRLEKLSKKYGLMWRNNCWKMRLARQSRERRRRQKESVQAKLEAQNSRDQIVGSRALERQTGNAQSDNPGQPLQPMQRRPQVGSVPGRTQLSMPPPPLPATKSEGRHREKTPQGPTPTNLSPNRGALSYADPSALLKSQHSHRQSMLTTQGPDRTTSTYFHLKAMGIQPTTSALLPTKDHAYYGRQRSGSKRAREDDSDSEPDFRRPRHDSVESASASLSEGFLPRKRQANEFEVLGKSLGSSTSSNDDQRQSLDQLLEQARRTQEAMSDTVGFFRDETQELQRASAQNSRRSSLSAAPNNHYPRLDITSHPALQDADAQSVVSMASNASSRRTSGPPKYRNRTSKFLPREEYADARIQRGLSGSASPYPRSPHASDHVLGRPAREQPRQGLQMPLDFSPASLSLETSAADATSAVAHADLPPTLPSVPAHEMAVRPTSQNLISLGSSFSVPGSTSIASEFGEHNDGSGDSTGSIRANQQSAQSRLETFTPSPVAATNGMKLDQWPPLDSQNSDGLGVAAKDVSPPPLKRKIQEEANERTRALKMRKSSHPPSNGNRFALLADDDDGDESEEDSSENSNQGTERGSSVGFTSEEDDGRAPNGGQMHGHATGMHSNGEEEEFGTSESSYDHESDGGDATAKNASQADWGLKGGTSVEDAIEL